MQNRRKKFQRDNKDKGKNKDKDKNKDDSNDKDDSKDKDKDDNDDSFLCFLARRLHSARLVCEGEQASRQRTRWSADQFQRCYSRSAFFGFSF